MRISGLLNDEKSYKLSLLTLISINLCLFLSSKSIQGFPCLIFCIPLFIYLFKNNSSSFSRLKVNKLSLIFLIFLFLLIYISLIINANNVYARNLEYFFWPFLSLLNLIPILVVCFIINQDRKLSHRSSFIIFLFFLFFTILSLMSTERFRFGFGPNMLYRILIFNYILFSLTNSTKLFSYITLPFLLITLNKIGSRGALITIILLFTFLILTSFKSNKFFFRIIIFTFILFYNLLLDKLLILFNSYRIFKINLTENNRTDFYLNFFEWYEQASLAEIIFGSGFRSWPFIDIYPHNFILESFHGYGITVTLIILLLVVFLFLFQNKQIILLSIPFIVGSLISGSLYDNITLIGFLFLFVFETNSIYNKHTSELSVIKS